MSAPAYNVVAGRMVREVEQPTPESLTRLEYLRRRAEAMGHGAYVVNHGDGEHLSVIVRDGKSQMVGTLVCDAATAENEEKWRLTADCTVAAGLMMQVDWLPENARRVREVFAALVCP